MKITRFACALLASAVAVSANATVFYSNYTPSTGTPEHRTGAFALDDRTPDASQTFTSYADLYVGLADCCNQVRQYAFTEFVATSSFTTSHIILPLQFVSHYGGQNIAFLLEQYDSATDSWSSARSDSWATVRGSMIGSDIGEIQLAFGTNATAVEEHFSYRPIDVVEGGLYRIRAAHSAGSMGYIRWYESDMLAAPGQTESFGSGAAGLNYERPYQLAFALTDGSLSSPSAVAPVPEPATWAMMIGGFGMVGSAMRRRKASVAFA